MEQYRYCPLCAAELTGTYVIGNSYRHCPTGHYTYYPNQVVGAIGVIHQQGKVLLERRAIEPGFGLWGLPGGMAEQGESISDCLIREIYEETGLNIQVSKLLQVLGGLDVCIVGYEAEIISGNMVKSSESLELQWFELDQIPFEQFAFPRHVEMLETWLKQYAEQ